MCSEWGAINSERWENEMDIPYLASRVAVEIDKLIDDKKGNLEPVKILASRIANSVKLSSGPEEKQFLNDPFSAVMINNAIVFSGLSEYIDNINDFVSFADELVNKLNAIASNIVKAQVKDIDNLNNMRKFCLALSRCSSLQRPMDEIEVEYSYRR